MARFAKNSCSTLYSWFSGARRVSLAVHARPDGDAIGSASALAEYLRRSFGTQVRILVPDPCPGTLAFLVDATEVLDASADMPAAIEWLAGSDLLVSLDHGDFSRTDELEPYLREARCRKVLVDHHQNPSLQDYGLAFSSVEVSSTCELLYGILMQMPGVRGAADLPARCAYCLMAGMTTDTNNFANSVFPSTLKMASDLLDAGVDRDGLLDSLYNSYRENRLRAMGCFLSEKLHITEDGVAYAVFDAATLARFSIEEGETEGFVNLPLGIGRVNFSIFLKEDGDVMRVSIRSKKGYSASRFARRYFNGGGHENAAGGRLGIPGNIVSAAAAGAYVEKVSARFLREGAESCGHPGGKD